MSLHDIYIAVIHFDLTPLLTFAGYALAAFVAFSVVMVILANLHAALIGLLQVVALVAASLHTQWLDYYA